MLSIVLRIYICQHSQYGPVQALPRADSNYPLLVHQGTCCWLVRWRATTFWPTVKSQWTTWMMQKCSRALRSADHQYNFYCNSNRLNSGSVVSCHCSEIRTKFSQFDIDNIWKEYFNLRIVDYKLNIIILFSVYVCVFVCVCVLVFWCECVNVCVQKLWDCSPKT